MAFRTQKISQMTPKGSDLEATDLLEVSTIESGSYVTRSITGQEIIDAAVGNVDWGDIGGTLSDQTDLNTALSGKVPTTRTLTINGTTQDLSADRTFTISTGITIGTTAITSGTVGRVLFEGTGNVVSESANLFWDNTNGRLGIGTNAPSGRIHVKGSVASEIFKAESTIAALYAQFVSTDGAGEFGIYTDAFYFQPLPSLANGTRFLNGANAIIMQLAQTGNVLINTTTDAGFRLDVNGTARVQTSLEIAGATGVTLGGGASALAYSGNVLNIGNSASWTDIRLFAGGVQKFSQTSTLSTISNTTINLSTATVQLAGVNALTYSGTDIRIGSVAAGFNSLSMYVAGSERARIASTGNVLINTTTDAGFRLDVNGTARVSAKLTVNNDIISSRDGNFVGRVDVSNTTSGASSLATFIATSSAGSLWVGKYSATTTANKITLPNDSFIANLSVGDLAISNDVATGKIKFASGGASTAQMTLASTGNLLINTTTDVASSKLTIESTTQGFLPPRMTTTQKNAIATPATGLQIYDSTLNRPCFYDGTTWITL